MNIGQPLRISCLTARSIKTCENYCRQNPNYCYDNKQFNKGEPAFSRRRAIAVHIRQSSIIDAELRTAMMKL